MEQKIKIFEEKLARLSDVALVARFNQEVDNPGWVSSRAYFLKALCLQFEKRGIDYSIVRNESGGFNLNAKVVLKDGKLIF